MENIDYLKAIEDMIEIEEEMEERAVFSEPYINQLKRRKRIYQRGFKEGYKKAMEEKK